MTETVNIENQEEACKRILTILGTEDLILCKSLALDEINRLNKNTELIQSLSLEAIFVEFLSLCFNFFIETDVVEKCVDMLLLAKLGGIKVEKYGFKEIIDKLIKKPRFSSLEVELKSILRLGQKKSGKRVSWQDDRNEIRYFAKEEENVEFKHGGYKDKDKLEAVPWKSECKKEVESHMHWFPPLKYRNVIGKETEEAKEQKLREMKSFLLQNGNAKMEFNPIDLNFERKRIKTKTITFFDSSCRNDVGEIRKIKHNQYLKNFVFDENDFYDDPINFISKL